MRLCAGIYFIVALALLAEKSDAAVRMAAPFPGGTRFQHTSAFDPASGRIFVYGGSGVDTQGTVRTFPELWIFDTSANAWHGPLASGSPLTPSALNGASMAYDFRRNELVLVGGSIAGNCLDDTWRFSFADSSWYHVQTQVSWPEPRKDATLTYANDTGTLWWLFGNCAGTYPFDDYWSAPQNDTTWTRHRTTSASVERTAHVAMFDTRRSSLLVYGGYRPILAAPVGDASDLNGSGFPGVGGVWRYQPDVELWTELDSVETRRSWLVGSYDALADWMVVYGGRSTGGGATDTIDHDVRAFDLATNAWVDVPDPPSEFRRAHAIGHYCPCSGELFVFGGMSSSQPGNDFENVHGEALLFSVEEPAVVSWTASMDASGDTTALQGSLSMEDESTLSGVNRLRAVDCRYNLELGVLTGVATSGSNMWQVTMESPSPEARDALRSGKLVLVGYRSSSTLPFVARTIIQGGGSELAVLGSRPNPATGQTAVSYRLGGPDVVLVDIVDVHGRHIRTLESSYHEAGEHTVLWDGKDGRGRRVAAGVWFVTVRSSRAKASVKVVIAR